MAGQYRKSAHICSDRPGPHVRDPVFARRTRKSVLLHARCPIDDAQDKHATVRRRDFTVSVAYVTKSVPRERSNGAAVDSGSADAADAIWSDDGLFDVAGVFELVGHERIAGMVSGDGHQALIHDGCGLARTSTHQCQSRRQRVAARSLATCRRVTPKHLDRSDVTPRVRRGPRIRVCRS
jgi:hypothetical protein